MFIIKAKQARATQIYRHNIMQPINSYATVMQFSKQVVYVVRYFYSLAILVDIMSDSQNKFSNSMSLHTFLLVTQRFA